MRRKNQTGLFGFASSPAVRPKRKVKASLSSDMARRFKLSANVFLAVVVAVIVAIAGVDSAIEARNLPVIIALMVGVICVAVYAYVQLKRWLLRRRWLDGVEMQAIDNMAGDQFEETSAEIYRRLGYKVTVTKRTKEPIL